MALIRPDVGRSSLRSNVLQGFAQKLLKTCRAKADVFITGIEDFTISLAELDQLNSLLDSVCQDKHADGTFIALPDASSNDVFDVITNLHDFIQQFQTIKLLPPGLSNASVLISKHFASLTTVKLSGVSPLQINFTSFPRALQCLQLTKAIAVADGFEGISQLSSSLRVLTLNHCGLNRVNFPLLQNLHCLETCDLSFNKLSTLSCLINSNSYTTFCSDSGFLGCPVSTLNVSHNNLRDVLGLEMLTNLIKLDLSYNCLTVDSAGWHELRELDQLKQLDLIDNPISMCGNYRVFIISLLPLPPNVTVTSLRRPSPNSVKVQLPSILAMQNVTGICLDGRLASFGEMRASRQTFSWNLAERRGNRMNQIFSTPLAENLLIPAVTRLSVGSPASSLSPVNKPASITTSNQNMNESNGRNSSDATPLGASPQMSQSLLLSANIVQRGELCSTPHGTMHSPAEIYSTPAVQMPAPAITPIPKEPPAPTAIAEPFLVTRVPPDGAPILLSVVSADENLGSITLAGLLISSVDFKLELVETAISGTVLRRLAAPSASAVNCDNDNVVQFWTIVLSTTLTLLNVPSSVTSNDLSTSIASSSITAGPGSRTFVSLQFDSSSEVSRFLELLGGNSGNNNDLGKLKSQVLSAFL